MACCNEEYEVETHIKMPIYGNNNWNLSIFQNCCTVQDELMDRNHPLR
jgi:hypothetical protein